MKLTKFISEPIHSLEWWDLCLICRDYVSKRLVYIVQFLLPALQGKITLTPVKGRGKVWVLHQSACRASLEKEKMDTERGIYCTLTKKENQIFLIYKEIQSGAVAKSYMRKGFLIYEKMREYFPMYEEAISHIWLCNCSIPNFLILYMRKIWFYFFQFSK